MYIRQDRPGFSLRKHDRARVMPCFTLTSSDETGLERAKVFRPAVADQSGPGGSLWQETGRPTDDENVL